MYIATATQRHPNDTARLLSPLMTPNQNGACFRFWYHMYGPNIDSLNVYTRPNNGETQTLMWTRTGTQSNEWQFAELTIKSSVQYQVFLCHFV